MNVCEFFFLRPVEQRLTPPTAAGAEFKIELNVGDTGLQHQVVGADDADDPSTVPLTAVLMEEGVWQETDSENQSEPKDDAAWPTFALYQPLVRQPMTSGSGEGDDSVPELAATLGPAGKATVEVTLTEVHHPNSERLAAPLDVDLRRTPDIADIPSAPLPGEPANRQARSVRAGLLPEPRMTPRRTADSLKAESSDSDVPLPTEHKGQVSPADPKTIIGQTLSQPVGHPAVEESKTNVHQAAPPDGDDDRQWITDERAIAAVQPQISALERPTKSQIVIDQNTAAFVTPSVHDPDTATKSEMPPMRDRRPPAEPEGQAADAVEWSTDTSRPEQARRTMVDALLPRADDEDAENKQPLSLLLPDVAIGRPTIPIGPTQAAHLAPMAHVPVQTFTAAPHHVPGPAVRLQSDELGTVHISVRTDDGVSSIQILADSPDTARLMQQNVDILRAELPDATRIHIARTNDNSFATGSEGGRGGFGGSHDQTGQGRRSKDPEPAMPQPGPQTHTSGAGGLDLRL